MPADLDIVCALEKPPRFLNNEYVLTKSDLNKIGQVIDEKLEKGLDPVKKDLTVLRQDVTVLRQDVTVLRQDVTVLKKDVSVLKGDVSVLKSDVSVLKKDVKYLKKKVNRIDKTVSLTVENYDEGDIKLERRVKKIEAHIGLTS